MSLNTEKVIELTKHVKIGDRLKGDFCYHSNWRNWNNTQSLNLDRSLVAYKDIIVVDNKDITIMSMSDIYRKLNNTNVSMSEIYKRLDNLEKDNKYLKQENTYLKDRVREVSK